MTLLPVLVVLFVFSYGLMTMVIVEQGRTIDAQRGLIQNIFHDTVELTALKGKIFQQNRAESLAHAVPQKGAAAETPAAPAPDKAQVESPLANQSDPQSKVNLAVENIHRIWEVTKDDRLAQLVFCDCPRRKTGVFPFTMTWRTN